MLGCEAPKLPNQGFLFPPFVFLGLVANFTPKNYCKRSVIGKKWPPIKWLLKMALLFFKSGTLSGVSVKLQ